MTIRELISNTLTEGVAENLMLGGLSVEDLKTRILKEKNNLKFEANKKEFKVQYPTLQKFIKRAFDMYNRVVENNGGRVAAPVGFNTLQPFLEKFYNSI